jgi:hypothetical protein
MVGIPGQKIINNLNSVEAFKLQWLQLDSIGNDTTELEPAELRCAKHICCHIA